MPMEGWKGGGGVPSTFPFSNFRANMVRLNIFSLTDAPRMCLQIQNLFGIIIIIALTIEKKNQFGVGLDPPPPPTHTHTHTVGHQRVKISSAFRSFNFVHFSNQLKLTPKNVNPLNFTRNKGAFIHFDFISMLKLSRKE